MTSTEVDVFAQEHLLPLDVGTRLPYRGVSLGQSPYSIEYNLTRETPPKFYGDEVL